MKKFILGIIAGLCMLTSPAFAQNTSVSGTVAGFANGFAVATWNNLGATAPPPQTTVTAQISSTGAFTMILASNSYTTYTPSQWIVKLCAGNPQFCTSQNIYITGSTQNISSAFSSAPTPPNNVCPSGMCVSTGLAWGASKATPTGVVVGTTDTQTLTNKTVDGVTPTTFGYVDPTSSVQTQLNNKPTVYIPAGTLQAAPHSVIISGTMTGGTLAVTLTAPAAFTSGSTYSCAANDATAANGVEVTYTSGTSVTFTGTSGDNVRGVCVGN